MKGRGEFLSFFYFFLENGIDGGKLHPIDASRTKLKEQSQQTTAEPASRPNLG